MVAWIFLLSHLAIISLIFYFCIKYDVKNWFLGRQEVEVIGGPGEISGKWDVNPTIRNVNDFFACVFPNLLVLPLIVWTVFVSPISFFLRWKIKEIAQKTQKDGTDSFFLVNEFPTSRKQIFWGKIFFLVSSLVGLYLVIFALPLSLLLWKTNYLVNFTGIQTFLFLAWNFLITPIFFFAPLVIFFSSAASINFFWYIILQIIPNLCLSFFIYQGVWGRWDKHTIYKKFSEWLSQHYLLAILLIAGGIISLSLFTACLAQKKFQRKDLI